MEQNGIQAVLHCLPPQIRSRIQQLSAAALAPVQELRLRAERPVCIQIHGREQLLQPESVLSQKAVEQVFQAVCEYSVYRYAKEIAEGFVTIAGGNRVGIAGSAVYQEGKLVQMRHISGLNFRVSHAVTGCAESLYRRTCARQPASLLLVVCSGGGIGFLYAMRLRQDRTNLERLCQMLREIAVQIAFRSLTVQELLEQLCRETAYAAFQFPVTVLSGMEQGLPLAEAWAAGIRQDKAVPEPAKKLLLPLGEELGASDLDGQAATLAQ